MSILLKSLYKTFEGGSYHNYLKQKRIRKLKLVEIQKIQWSKLKELLEFVYNSSVFYHNNFKSIGLTPQDIKTYEDFSKLPIVNKQILKKNYKEIITKGSNEKDYYTSYTSGSTGEPFSFLIDKKREDPSTGVAFMLNMENIGIDPFEKMNKLMIKAEPVNVIKDLNKPNKQTLVHRLKYKFFSETFGIRSTDIKKENIKAIYSIIKKNNIEIIYGYSSNIFYLAKLLKTHNLEVKLKYVILIAEGILKQQKDLIKNTFHCPVFMDYGASECMRMGFECNQHNGYHMDLYNYYFEYLDDNGKPVKTGDNANIIVTNLNNYIFPLIRYNVGDQGIISKEICTCGVNYPLVSQITGRQADIIKTPSGDELSLSNISVLFEYLYEYITNYQVILDKKTNTIIIKIIPAKDIKPDIIKETKEQISKLINHSMDIKIELVEKIPFEEHGKTKTLIIKS